MFFYMLDANMLSRIQFVFTVGYHIIFPAITIGMSLLLLVLEILWLKTKNKNYVSVYKFFAKFFAINFAAGVVTGIAMAFQFGTNWGKFTQFAAPAVGPLFAAETLTAFFLEAVFIGVMLFGWKRVHPLVHLLSTFFVFLGVHNSAFWIIVINSFMQTPAGVEVINGVVHVVSWKEVIFNPSMPYRMVHMLIAAYLTGALLAAAVLGYYILKDKYTNIAKQGFSVALWIVSIMAPLQILAGDLHGLNTLKYQPAKVAALEAIWNTERSAPFIVFAVPDEKNERNKFEISIPFAGSLILTHSLNGEVKGLKDWQKEDRPHVGLSFYSFRIMLLLGGIYFIIAVLSLYLRFRGNLYSTGFVKFVRFFGFTGVIAVIAGWFVTEIGRQPWLVYGVMRIKDGASVLTAGQVTFTLVAIFILYTFGLLIPLYIYVKKLFTTGLEDVNLIDVYGKDNAQSLN